MTTGVVQKQKRGGWRDMLDGWISVLTEPNLDIFRAQKRLADPLTTILGVGILGLVIGLWAIAVEFPSASTGSEAVWVDLLRIIFFIETDFYIISLILYFIAKGFGGNGNFREHSYLLSLVTVPLGMIVVAFLFVGEKLGLTLTSILDPLSTTGVVSVFIILLLLYGFLLLLFALQAIHEMQSSAVFYTLGTPVLAWGVLRIASMFTAGEENLITAEWSFIAEQWAKGTAQELLLGHLWLIVFSVSIAVVLGVTIGIFITMPPRKPHFVDLTILIPFVLFLFLWAVSSGLLGEGIADSISSMTRDWSRSLKKSESLIFAPLLAIISAIIAKPAALGMILAAFTLILYILFLVGEKAGETTLYVAGIILTIPSVALFGAMIKPLGIGPFNAVFALVLYAQLPILRNTYTGIKEVMPEIIESGRGMGMTEAQLLFKVKLPMAVPVIMTGVRVSIVMLVGIASIAAYIGNDTLGKYIFDGISRAQEKRYFAGAFLVAVLALVVDYFLDWLQNRLTPEGLKGRQEAT